MKTKAGEDLERKLKAKTKSEQGLTKELADLNTLHDRLKVDSRLKIDDLQRRLQQAEENLQKTQQELKQLNQKYVAEVRNGVEKL